VTGSRDHLEQAGFPFTRDLLGTAHLYHLPAGARRAWHDLLTRYRQHAGSDGNLPYAALTAALRAAGHTPVSIGPASQNQPPRFLASHRPLNPADLHDAFTVFEQAILGVTPDQIRFSYNSELAAQIAEIQPEPCLLSQQVHLCGHQPDAPGWVYDIATWQAASLLAGGAFKLDGLEIQFRTDTNGDLLVWDNDLLWTGSWGATYPTRHAALRVKLRMKTLPHLRLPILLMDPAVFWLADRLSSSRTAWLAQRDPAAPLLVLAVNGARGRPRDIDPATSLTLTILAKLRGEQPILPEERNLAGPPGRLRAVIPRSVRFPVGRGVGMHTVRELTRYVTETLGVRPISATPVPGHRFKARPKRHLGRDIELLDPQTLPETITASGCQSLRIVVLYAAAHTRRRIQNLLAYHFDRLDLASAAISDDDEIPLVPGAVTAVFHNASALLAHGPHTQRHQLAAAIRHLDPSPGVRILALCETNYDPSAWEEQRRKARTDQSVPDPDTIDAKHHVNRLLARRGAPTQFIATAPAPRTGQVIELTTADALTEAVRKDHPGHSALGDLLRSGGIIHSRIGEALAYGRHGLTSPHVFVGLHLREQKAVAGKRHLIYTLAALIPASGTSQWQMLGYSWHPHPISGKTGWMPYTEADVAFRAHDLAEGTRATAYDTRVPGAINQALQQLKPALGATPYVLLVSGESCRSIWPGLANKHLDRAPGHDGTIDDRTPLPGPPGFKPAAIVRITADTTEVPRPVRGVRISLNQADPDDTPEPEEVVKTTNALYELDLNPGTGRAWTLATVPRQFDGKGRQRRLGSDISRWQADPEQQQANWYAHTATEILIVGAAADTQLSYAVAAARLCDHTIAWDSRTRYPVPLHGAYQMDKDHPEYRRTIEHDDEPDEATSNTQDMPPGAGEG
jgi:RNaseH domain of pPIWI_RE/pPIWI_RE module N-terminal domain